MAGTRSISFAAILALSLFASEVQAFHGRFGTWSSSSSMPSTYVYYAAPLYFYYCPGPLVLPVPDAYPGRPLAKPSAAPPSASAEPPLGLSGARAPKITTTRSPNAPSSVSESCLVGFWNLTGRDVSLTIEGKTWSLAKNQMLNFTVERQFSWQIAGRSPHVERVADGLARHEVILRE